MRDWVRRRPVLAAALLYLILGLALFSPAFAPGRTLSAGDYLWTAVPWEAERPAEVPGLGSNQEQQDANSYAHRIASGLTLPGSPPALTARVIYGTLRLVFEGVLRWAFSMARPWW